MTTHGFLASHDLFLGLVIGAWTLVIVKILVAFNAIEIGTSNGNNPENPYKSWDILVINPGKS